MFDDEVVDKRIDTQSMRKARGAFFTPEPVAEFLARWAIRSAEDTVLEPSCGDAVFLKAAGDIIRRLNPNYRTEQLTGYDIHADSLEDADALLRGSAIRADLVQSDFFEVNPSRRVTSMIGNPPFIRFQGFSGRSRELAQRSASAVGVSLSGLASSWASFVLHGSRFLVDGGRMGLVLPAELLSVNYAAPIRRFLLESFSSVDVVVFDELVFAGIQADVVLLLADDFGMGRSTKFTLHNVRNADELSLSRGSPWTPATPESKWTDALAPSVAPTALADMGRKGLAPASLWGRVTSGMVTGANDFFVISEARARELGLDRDDLIPTLPSGVLSSTTAVTKANWNMQVHGAPGLLFRPQGNPGEAARRYIAEGESRELHLRYKCRVRDPWWRVPGATAPDLFISYMSGSTPRVVTNSARVLNLNSVHGMSIRAEDRMAARALPILALNSASLFSAELVGRTYGGGVLKLEPSEASQWLLPTQEIAVKAVRELAPELRRSKALVRAGDLISAQAVADEILVSLDVAPVEAFQLFRESRLDLVMRRTTRATVD